MTTIATDGKSMAGDGLSVDGGGLICSQAVVKVHRLRDKSIVGLAGTPFQIKPMVDWLNAGAKPASLPNMGDQNWDVLHLKRDGTIVSYGSNGHSTVEEAPAAVGSGCDIAIGAMMAGASPKKAVGIACHRHTGSGGTITEISL